VKFQMPWGASQLKGNTWHQLLSSESLKHKPKETTSKSRDQLRRGRTCPSLVREQFDSSPPCNAFTTYRANSVCFKSGDSIFLQNSLATISVKRGAGGAVVTLNKTF